MEAWDDGGSLAREQTLAGTACGLLTPLPLCCRVPPDTQLRHLHPSLPTNAPRLLVTESSEELVTLPNSVLASVAVADWRVAPSPKAAPLVKAGWRGQGGGRGGRGSGQGGEWSCGRGQGGEGTLPGNSSELL